VRRSPAPRFDRLGEAPGLSPGRVFAPLSEDFMTASEFRRIALSLPQALEAALARRLGLPLDYVERIR